MTRITLLALLACLLASPPAAARKSEALAKVDAAADLIAIQPLIDYAEVRVTVSGPDGFEVVKTFAADEAPIVDLPGIDGFYKYELRFSPVLSDDERQQLAAARDAGSEIGELKHAAKLTVQNGSFTVAGGSPVVDSPEPQADKVVLTGADGVIRNSLCVGFDCPNSPAFDDSTILLMENNTRIKFGDTSASPFPNNDWEIEANSNLSGGASYLGFNDCGSADNDGGCATDLVFAVESGARQSALYVESDGDVGIGTSNPVLDLHIVTGNSPAIRLDQDGSSGFAPQVWDIAGNETSFFVRDATGGSTLPFRIRPGAPSNSIFLDADGDVGLGSGSPSRPLHILGSSGNEGILIEDTGAAVEEHADMLVLQARGGQGFQLIDSTNGDNWVFTQNVNGRFVINSSETAGNEFLFNQNGNLTISGTITTSGSCSIGCDRVFADEYELESIEEHAAYMWENRHLQGVGPTPEGTPINVTEKTEGILNELEKAHIYIEQLNSDRQRKDAVIEDLTARLARLEAMLLHGD
jgi:hypothetical protein